MNDEIKEILDKLKDGNWYNELDLTGTMWIELRWEETHLLLDYITNLQQENERLKTKTKEQSLLLIDYQDMEQKYEDYKSRIEKAVEYIEKSKEINYKTIDTLSEEVKLLKGILNGENVMLNNILNILNGRSDE